MAEQLDAAIGSEEISQFASEVLRVPQEGSHQIIYPTLLVQRLPGGVSSSPNRAVGPSA
jgi:hypothetical protein